jgi:hypothetical protein
MKNTVKNATRHLVCKAYEAFSKNKKYINVISLPGDVWEFENYAFLNKDFSWYFNGNYSIEMTLLEKDEIIYNRHMYAKKNFRPVNTNSYYILDRHNVTYKNEVLNESHVKNCSSDNIFAWFDFCGNPTTENVNLVNTATGKNVTYIFTFNTAWRMDTNVLPELRDLAALHQNKAVAIKLHFEKLAEQLGLTVIWCFDYVANYAPMISVCLSNDVNVIADKSLYIHSVDTSRKNNLSKRNVNINKTVKVKRDLSAVYVDAKAGIEDGAICTKHNISAGTLAAVKAWITMGK